MTFTAAAYTILKESGKPMHVRQITEQALRRGVSTIEKNTR